MESDSLGNAADVVLLHAEKNNSGNCGQVFFTALPWDRKWTGLDFIGADGLASIGDMAEITKKYSCTPG